MHAKRVATIDVRLEPFVEEKYDTAAVRISAAAQILRGHGGLADARRADE